MSIYKVSTENLGVQNAESFIRSVTEESAYYLFAANHIPSESGTLSVPTDSTSSLVDLYSNMIFGKRIGQSDVSIMANRYNWVSNTVYDMYDDSDPDLHSKQYYVLVQEGEIYRVYKCLFNNNGGPSIVEPFGENSDILEIPSDGYIWKYMYSFDLFTSIKFLTDTHMPIVEDLTVKAAAVPGSIDIIKIIYGGSGYNNYTTGSFKESSDLIIDSDPYQYGLDGNASLIDNFYNNCVIKITSGLAAGEYRTITDYTISNGRRIITIDQPFIGTVQRTDTYEIYPKVFLYDVGGTITSQCVARAIIGGSSNTVIRVEVLNPGQGYRTAKAELRPDASVGINSNFIAELKPIIPPSGGHGFDSYSELSGSFVGLSVSFIGDNEPLVVRGESDYRTIGILKDPLYANVRIFIDSSETSGQFLKSEDVYKFKQIKMSGNVSFNTSNTFVYSTESEIAKSLRIGDDVLIVSPTDQILSSVDTIVNDSTFSLTDQPSFADSDCQLYLINKQYLGKIVNAELSYIDLTDFYANDFTNNDYILGQTSIAKSKVIEVNGNYALINGRSAQSFSAFNQLTKFYGELQSDVQFINDEQITQNPDDQTSPNGNVYKFENNLELNKDIIYASNITNTFITIAEGGSGIVTGLSSNAYFISQYKYDGDLVSDSGNILYIENTNPINRSVLRSETIKLILRF